MNTLGPDLQNEDILFFFLANPSNNNSCYPHLAFWVLGALPDDLLTLSQESAYHAGI